MLQKKVCLLGSFGVGKTSLVSRYVEGRFTDKYLSTVGVKISRREEQTPDALVRMVLWDLQGQDDLQSVRASHLRGSHGFVFVVDGTRSETLNVVLELHERVSAEVGPVPGIVLLNKADLIADWTLDPEDERLAEMGHPILQTSAKTGDNVEAAFARLALTLAG